MISEVHSYEIEWSLADLERDAHHAIGRWDWRRGAHGHALSLPTAAQLHPARRYAYENQPCTGILRECPTFAAIFDFFPCDKLSFRLLRRPPQSAYGWHTDRWRGPGIARFQIPIVSNEASFLVLTDYEDPTQLRRSAGASFDQIADANRGHLRVTPLAIGKLHYFETARVHTLVNDGSEERIVLSFDLVANAWLRERFPEIAAEVGEGEEIPIPSALARAAARVKSYSFPMRRAAQRWLRREHGLG